MQFKGNLKIQRKDQRKREQESWSDISFRVTLWMRRKRWWGSLLSHPLPPFSDSSCIFSLKFALFPPKREALWKQSQGQSFSSSPCSDFAVKEAESLQALLSSSPLPVFPSFSSPFSSVACAWHWLYCLGPQWCWRERHTWGGWWQVIKYVHGQWWASQVALVIKNLPTSARDIRGAGSIPGSGRSPGVEHGSPLQCPCLEKPMDWRAWWPMVLRVGHDWSDLAAAWMVGVHIGISKPEAVVFPRSLSVSWKEMVGWGGGKGV